MHYRISVCLPFGGLTKRGGQACRGKIFWFQSLLPACNLPLAGALVYAACLEEIKMDIDL